MSVFARLRATGNFETSAELIEYPAELEGGRNLLRNTNYDKMPEKYGGSQITIVKGVPNSAIAETTTTFAVIISDRLSNFVQGAVYTISFEVKTTSIPFFDYNYFMDADEGNVALNSTALMGIVSLKTDGEWHTYSRTFVSPATRTNAGLMLGKRACSPGDNFEIRKVKLEIGDAPTIWTKSPEDLGLAYPKEITSFKSVFTDKFILTKELEENAQTLDINIPTRIMDGKLQLKNQMEEGVVL